MMSPLTVSQYINPEKIKFDTVIFDEASQIMPEDAVPCLIRAKQAIVMGDTQQLPPTNFFMSTDNDENVDEEIEDLPSFLSESSIRFREKRLEWHYRSQNESLIDFSNKYFYGNRLVTFPNPSEEKDGIQFIHVKDGIYDLGKSRQNRKEASEVVKLYQKIKREQADKTIGIIAFSIAQERAIREAFLTARIDIDTFINSTSEELFVKNLETVQGDERDIIIISVGYGKNAEGKLSYNFGPINKEGGYKRLNVAITRSRYKTFIVSSILPEELDPDKINAEGLRHLKNYLCYAKEGVLDGFIEKTEDLGFDSSFEEAVYDALIQEGYSVSTQVGCSGYRVDLAIKHPLRPGEYILGVECDGAQYHSSKYARDRDKIRQDVLTRLRWNIHRIWSEDWLRNKEFELNKIRNKVDALITSNESNKSILKEEFDKVESAENVKEITLNSLHPTYEVAELELSRMTLDFDSQGKLTRYCNIRRKGSEILSVESGASYEAKNKIVERMVKVLEVETPIEKELLYKRVLDSAGIQKLGRRIRALLDEIINQQKNIKKCISIKKQSLLSQLMLSQELEYLQKNSAHFF